MDRELQKRLFAIQNDVNGNTASIMALTAVLAAAPEISRVEKLKVGEILDALTADQPALQLLRRRAGDVANQLIDQAANADSERQVADEPAEQTSSGIATE